MYSLLLDNKVQPVLKILAWLARNIDRPTPSKRLRRTLANARRHAERMSEAQKLPPDLSNELLAIWSRYIEPGTSDRWPNEQVDFKRFAEFIDALLVPEIRARRIELVNDAEKLKLATTGMFNAEIENVIKNASRA